MNSTHYDQRNRCINSRVKQHKDKLHQTLTMQYPFSDITVCKDVQSRAIHSTWSNVTVSKDVQGRAIYPHSDITVSKDILCRAIYPTRSNVNVIKDVQGRAIILPAQWYQFQQGCKGRAIQMYILPLWHHYHLRFTIWRQTSESH